MRNYDSLLSFAKQAATDALIDLQRSNPNADASRMALALDELNKRWDELTDALVRQRRERDRIISELISELAEAKKC